MRVRRRVADGSFYDSFSVFSELIWHGSIVVVSVFVDCAGICGWHVGTELLSEVAVTMGAERDADGPFSDSFPVS